MKHFLVILCLFAALLANARIEQVADTLDFGTFHEENGRKTMRTYVVNTGDKPTSIFNVKASCGCTATNYYKEIINPGDSAWIDVSYNPRGRIGRFEKGVKVYDVDDGKVTIAIRGNVISTPETLETIYPVAADGLYLSERQLIVPELKKGDSRHLFINAYNATDEILKPRLTGEYKEIEAVITPEAIEPGETAAISFYVMSRHAEGTGTKNYRYELLTHPDSNPSATTPIEISIGITE